jgi:hypothetical protein
MSRNFEDTWADIQRRLPVRERIQNWSADKGYTGGRFRITDVEPSSVTIEADGTSVPRQVAKSEFQKIFADWPAYRVGTIRRSALRDKYKNTTYILSILHWQETSST